MNPLLHFYNDKTTSEAVKVFMLEQLEQMAVEAVFSKKPTDGIFEAKELVDKMFATLKELYEPRQKAVIESPR